MIALLWFFLFVTPFAVAAPHGGWRQNCRNRRAKSMSWTRTRTRTRTRVAAPTDDGTGTSTTVAAPSISAVQPSSAVNPSSAGQTKPTTSAAAPSVPAPTGVWQPKVGTSWQIMLSKQIKFDGNGGVTPNVEVYDVDMFDTPAETITKLHEAGKKVICYFSAGSYEEWRPDANLWTDLGSSLVGWAGESWADVRTESVRNIMKSRIAMAASKGCDAIDPDNVDGFNNKNGLGLTAADAADFVKFLAAEAAKYNMATGIKNAAAIIPDVLPHVQFSVNEECGEIGECDLFAPMTAAGKPVFNIEYPSGAPSVTPDDEKKMCGAVKSFGFSTVLKKMDLDGWVEYCDGSSFTTQ